MISSGYRSDHKLTKYTPCLGLTSMLRIVLCEYFLDIGQFNKIKKSPKFKCKKWIDVSYVPLFRLELFIHFSLFLLVILQLTQWTSTMYFHLQQN